MLRIDVIMPCLSECIERIVLDIYFSIRLLFYYYYYLVLLLLYVKLLFI